MSAESVVQVNRNRSDALVHAIRPVIGRFRTAIETGDIDESRRSAREIAATFLGAKPRDAAAGATFGFWIPGLPSLQEAGGRFELELFLPDHTAEIRRFERGEERIVELERYKIPMKTIDEFVLADVEGVPAGARETMGALYWLRYRDGRGVSYILRDPLASSLPWGIYAPAELYDVESMLEEREDTDYLRGHYRERYPDGSLRAHDIGTTLEIHVGTATEEGTIAGLTRFYRAIATKISSAMETNPDEPYRLLNSFEKAFVGYDSVELMPEVPPAERVFSQTGEFFRLFEEEDDTEEMDAPLPDTELTTSGTSHAAGLAQEARLEGKHKGSTHVKLKKPDVGGWGYDVVLFGTAAINPSILESGRPHEFLELIETLHRMPDRPIQVALDSVLGHADFQGAVLLARFDTLTPPEDVSLKYRESAFLKGPNMYGRDVNYGDPLARAVLLEMYRRKNDYGVDAIRVDGGQDFVADIDEETGLKIQDDAFLQEMSEYRQKTGGVERRLDINIEDGRPWPDDINWIYNSAYLCHVWERQLPDGDRTKQWGPLIFAHNVHGKFRWFFDKWDRFKDCFTGGEDWITGNSTHDNLRYFYRMVPPRSSKYYDPSRPREQYYNSELGERLYDAPGNALDNPALTALNVAMFPGSPMFFLQATLRSPWMFFRDIQDRYDVKVVADEAAKWLTWNISPELYRNSGFFPRMKRLGFKTLASLVAPDGAGLPAIFHESRGDDNKKRGFLDILLSLHDRIKTDDMVALYLFEPKHDVGGFRDFGALTAHAAKLEAAAETIETSGKSGSTTPERRTAHTDGRASGLLPADARASQSLQRRVKKLKRRIAQDPIESDRKLTFVQKKLADAAVMYDDDTPEHADRRDKIDLLQKLAKKAPGTLQLLIEDAAEREDYDVEAWAKHKPLIAAAPGAMLDNGRLTAESLRGFAAAFMRDASEACVVTRHQDRLEERTLDFAFACRRFRQENPWLAKNPGNDIRLDFFNRNMVANGARQVGGWSDTGDPLHANTVYYGWRTSPDGTRQFLFLANMEGRPLRRYSLRFLFPFDDEWIVVLRSPGLEHVPERVSRETVITDFRAGTALVMERRPQGA